MLYHGSSYKHRELKPGIAYTGKKVQWDKTESNEYLYATPDREEAISQAFASMLEKRYPLNRYQTEGDAIRVTFDKGASLSHKDVAQGVLYLYTLAHAPEDKWKKTNNTVNGLDNEYRTQSTISKHIVKVEEIAVADWLKGKSLSFPGSMESIPASFRW